MRRPVRSSSRSVGEKGKADRTLHEIDYPHIMPQVYYTPAEVKLVPLDVKTTAKRVGYVKGAGDDVPQAMEQLGVTVEFVEPAGSGQVGRTAEVRRHRGRHPRLQQPTRA
jgi:hypothetical protein